MSERQNKVHLDIDKDRLLESFDEACRIVQDTLHDLDLSVVTQNARDRFKATLDIGQIALTDLTFPLPNRRMSDLVLHVNMQKKKFSVRSKQRTKIRANMNAALRCL